MSKQDQILK